MSMKKVLYFHGLGGERLGERVESLARMYDIHLISPSINYELFIGNPYIFPAYKTLGKQVDFVVGNSMGGYFSYHVGKACGIPSLNFNPALSNKTTSFNWFNLVTSYKPCVEQKLSLIYMSTLDKVVDHDAGRKFLETENYPTNKIKPLEGMTHSLSFNFIFSETIKFVNNI